MQKEKETKEVEKYLNFQGITESESSIADAVQSTRGLFRSIFGGIGRFVDKTTTIITFAGIALTIILILFSCCPCQRMFCQSRGVLESQEDIPLRHVTKSVF